MQRSAEVNTYLRCGGGITHACLAIPTLVIQLVIYYYIFIKGQRERLSPLPKIIRSTHPIWVTAGVSLPTCNGRASPWRHRLIDHGNPSAK